MNDLNKHQLILLVILVCFIVSMATAVSTVALLENQPASIPTTINRIVEHTIEKVSPGDTPVVKQETEDDLAAKAVQMNLPNVVTVMIRAWDVASEAKVPAGVGVLANDGFVFTALTSLPERADFFIKTSDGTVYEAVAVAKDVSSGVGVLTFRDKTKAAKLSHATLSSVLPETGDTVLAIGGKEKHTIRKGIVSSVEAAESGDGAEKVFSKIYTTADLISQDSGGPLLSLKGEVLGVDVVTKDGNYAVPAQILLGLTKTVGSAAGR